MTRENKTTFAPSPPERESAISAALASPAAMRRFQAGELRAEAAKMLRQAEAFEAEASAMEAGA